jgi:acyl-CoA thioesterase FadM
MLQPNINYLFQCRIPIRITDINYGGHAGNDTILTLVHEARMQFLQSLGYTEMNLEGVGMIMARAEIEFKSELFYPETIVVDVAAGNLTRVGFDLFYRLRREGAEEKKNVIALVRTGMICYDYSKKKIASLPDAAAKRLVP